MVAASLAIAAGDSRYAYNQPGDRRFVSNTAVLERRTPAGANKQSHKVESAPGQVTAVYQRVCRCRRVRDAAAKHAFLVLRARSLTVALISGLP